MVFLLIIVQRVDFAQFLGNKELKTERNLLETPKAQIPLNNKVREQKQFLGLIESGNRVNLCNGQSAAKLPTSITMRFLCEKNLRDKVQRL